jgi:hypothetical protein
MYISDTPTRTVEETIAKQSSLPVDLANGIITTLLSDVDPEV